MKAYKFTVTIVGWGKKHEDALEDAFELVSEGVNEPYIVNVERMPDDDTDEEVDDDQK